jgi:hypothetical protein
MAEPGPLPAAGTSPLPVAQVLSRSVYFVLIPFESIKPYNRDAAYQWIIQDAYRTAGSGMSWASPESILVMLECDRKSFQQAIASIRATVRNFGGNAGTVHSYHTIQVS